jgi:conjugal transfer pilus assembly protein TraV
MNTKLLALCVSTGMFLGGCAGGINGLGAIGEFKCKAPEGVQCTSMSGVKANLQANNLPGQTPLKEEGRKESSEVRAYREDSLAAGAKPVIESAPGAIRSLPETIRIWVAPWEDADGDLNEESKIYLVVNQGRWLVEHNKRKIETEFGPSRVAIIPPSGTGQDGGADTAITGPASKMKGAPGKAGQGASGSFDPSAIQQGLMGLAQSMKKAGVQP